MIDFRHWSRAPIFKYFQTSGEKLPSRSYIFITLLNSSKLKNYLKKKLYFKLNIFISNRNIEDSTISTRFNKLYYLSFFQMFKKPVSIGNHFKCLD